MKEVIQQATGSGPQLPLRKVEHIIEVISGHEVVFSEDSPPRSFVISRNGSRAKRIYPRRFNSLSSFFPFNVQGTSTRPLISVSREINDISMHPL